MRTQPYTLISSPQIKAARALLDWSQDDLAQASNLSVATIRKLELGHISPRILTTSSIRQAIEHAGLDLLDRDGVCRKQEEIAIFRGTEAIERITQDIVYASRHKTGTAFIVLPLWALRELMHYYEPQQEQGCIPSVKCLLTDTQHLLPIAPDFEYRYISGQLVRPAPFCVYGNKYAIAYGDNIQTMKIITIQSTASVLAGQQHFLSMWKNAAPRH